MFEPSPHPGIDVSHPRSASPTRRPPPPGAAGAEAGFVIGLVFAQAGIAITLPRVPPGGRKAAAASRPPLEVLFADAGPLVCVPSIRADLAAFFSRRRSGVLMVDLRAGDDAELAALAESLLAALPHDPLAAGLYADAIGALLAARCAEAPKPCPTTTRRPCGLLPKWRLKRVTEFVAAHLDEPITLADMSAAAKLTRMHFAAQFRATTGLRPHDYLLQQRIARAKELLEEDLPIVQVALAVGFQTQAHFTTVFGRIVGETPSRWRSARMAARGPLTETRARARWNPAVGGLPALAIQSGRAAADRAPA